MKDENAAGTAGETNGGGIAAIILGAGKGTRMKSDLPKVMMPVCGKPMIRHIIDTLEKIGVKDVVTVVSPDGDMVKNETAPYRTAVQAEQLGTGHAVRCAEEALKGGFDGPVLVIFGDTPLITEETFLKIADRIRKGYAVVVLGFRPGDPARYGRLKMSGTELTGIVEYKDATEEERSIDFCNSGCMGFDGHYLFKILAQMRQRNIILPMRSKLRAEWDLNAPRLRAIRKRSPAPIRARSWSCWRNFIRKGKIGQSVKGILVRHSTADGGAVVFDICGDCCRCAA